MGTDAYRAAGAEMPLAAAVAKDRAVAWSILLILMDIHRQRLVPAFDHR